MATKRRHKEDEKGRGRTRAAAIGSQYSSINSKHNAAYGRSLKNGRPDSLVMEVFGSHRQDSPSWKTTFSLWALFLDTACEGSTSAWPSGHQMMPSLPSTAINLAKLFSAFKVAKCSVCHIYCVSHVPVIEDIAT